MTEFIDYESFGAAGDGKTDDTKAIKAAHEYANSINMPVKTKANAVYYIGGSKDIIPVETSVYWGNSRFIIDDRNVEDRSSSVFAVRSKKEAIKLGIKSITTDTKSIEPVGCKCLVELTDNSVRHYIRKGPNQNDGSPAFDSFEITPEGNILQPVNWNLFNIDEAYALPEDETPLILKGGSFTTIANGEPSQYNYYSRNISVMRSLTVIDGLKHYIEGEGETGAPYGGFLCISSSANIIIKNCFFTGHKIYDTIGSAGVNVSMGSYDVLLDNSVEILIKNCRQNKISDKTRWGLVGSNFCKNITLDGCIFSRMDAHQGVVGYTIKNMVLGHQGLNAIGKGRMTVENVKSYGHNVINLRDDYGSTWEGELVIKNLDWVPVEENNGGVSIIRCDNDGTHDFGYQCFMPKKITMENIHIDDRRSGPVYFFSDYDPLDKDTERPYKYVECERFTVNNLSTESGKYPEKCINPRLLKKLRIKIK